MTTLSFRFRIAAVSAAMAFAAGCAGDLASAPSTTTRSAASWMAPDAKKNDLLYVSDLGTNQVDVLSYPKGTPEGTLTGFGAVHGGCVDIEGNVFITDAHNSEIIEYAHGDSTPIATLDDGDFGPVGCSVDRKSGDLAVANISPVFGSTSGDIAIYRHASGGPSNYTDLNIYLYYDCVYDGKGNLYVTGADQNGNFKFAELRRGHKMFENITVQQQIFIPGGVQWDGKHVDVEDQGAGYHGSTVYELSVSGSTATNVGTIALSGSTDVLQFRLYHHKLIGGNIGSAPNVMYWTYPGGTALKTLTGFIEPDGVTVSPGK